MNGRTHIWVGALAGAGALGAAEPLAVAVMVPVAAAASLLPDLDTEKALASKYLGKQAHAWTRAAAYWTWHQTATDTDRHAAARRAQYGIPEEHRTLTHTLLFCVAVGGPLCLVWWPLGVAAFTGLLSSVLADGCTKAGVPLLWVPWNWRIKGRRWYPFRLMGRLMKSGSSWEWVPGLAVAAVCAAVTHLLMYLVP